VASKVTPGVAVPDMASTGLTVKLNGESVLLVPFVTVIWVVTVDPIETLPGGTPDQAGKVSVDLSDTSEWKICAGAPAQKLLDSCLWESDLPPGGDAPTASKVNAGSSKVSTTITLRTGLLIRFRVADPQSVLPTSPAADVATTEVAKTAVTDTKTASPQTIRYLQVGVVTAKGHFFQAFPVETTSTATTYQVLVPSGIPLIVSIAAHNLIVLDSQGKLPVVPNSDRFVSSAADEEKVRTFTVIPVPVPPILPPSNTKSK
jgi:hypothetical protein